MRKFRKTIISLSIIILFVSGCKAESSEAETYEAETYEAETESSAYMAGSWDSSSDIVAKDRDSRAENPEANESIPDAAGELASGDDSYALSEEEKKVLLAYAKYLQNFYKEYPYETDEIKFDLVFIDIDNIPELAIIPSDAHVSGVIICVYNGGNAVEACEEWDWEELNVWGYDDAVFVNDIDDLYNELCKRFSFLKEQDRIEQDDPCPEEWKQAYLNYLEEDNYADTCTYSLIYVDDDDIPEMVVDTGGEVGGCQFLTFHDHVLDVWQSDRLNVTYIERGNLICNSDGNMGYYYDNVYTIQDGKWVYVDGGVWGDGPDGVQIDENDNWLVFFYWTGEEPWNMEEYWGGEEITGEEYDARLNAIYPMKQSMHPQKYYILDEIKSILRTGDVVSVNHRYELIVKDVTWKEAEMLCHERGGYLATITSHEELERIQERMISEHKEDITFFVGATNERVEGTPFGYRWLEPGIKYGYDMLDLYNALFRFWLEGEPSYTGLTESGVEVREEYVVLFYRETDGRCYLNDVPNDILGAAPSYAGRIGYICEYE